MQDRSLKKSLGSNDAKKRKFVAMPPQIKSYLPLVQQVVEPNR